MTAPVTPTARPHGRPWGKITLFFLGGLIFVCVVINFLASSFKREYKNTNESSIEKDNPNSDKNSGIPSFYTLPAIPSLKFTITGKDTLINVPIGYSIAFVCDQDYHVEDGDGNSYYGKANKDVDIGVVSSIETTAKLHLKIRTLGPKSTTMQIDFTPMQIPSKKPNQKSSIV